MDLLTETLKGIAPIDREWIARAEAKQLQLTKPPGSLGRLEEIACRFCAIQETLEPQVARRRIVVLAADHGVAAEGVSAYPQEVTAQMVANFCAGGAAINALARVARADLLVIDIGVRGNTQNEIVSAGEGCVNFITRRVRAGARNMAREPAMTETEMHAALRVGIESASEAARAGVTLIGLGDMGIGNTTAASAVTAALMEMPPAQVTGRGTGADDATFARKIKLIEQALVLNQPQGADALDVLRKVGGLEIAGLCGLCLGAAAARIGIVTDGFIATSGAALAVRLCPAVTDYIFAAHLSPEPGHQALLDLLGKRAILDLNMRLGEGTGAALAMNIIAAAIAAFTEMATFESAGVSDKGETQKESSAE